MFKMNRSTASWHTGLWKSFTALSMAFSGKADQISCSASCDETQALHPNLTISGLRLDEYCVLLIIGNEITANWLRKLET